MSELTFATPTPRATWRTRTEPLLWAVSLFWALLANRSFLNAALEGRDAAAPQTWLFGVALVVMLLCLHFLLTAPWAWGRATKPVLALLIVVSASATYFMQAFGVVLDPSMIRNVLHTDVAESRELMSFRLLGHLLLYAGLPLVLLWRVKLQPRRWLPALAWRLGSMLVALALLVGTMLAVFQPFSALMRNHKELRYLITPGNVVWSLGVVLAEQTRGAAQPRVAIGEDATPGPRLAARRKPLVVVMVVGETARAANWSLSGYARQTTPELAQRPVINFADVTSCGTNTEVSLPCMFAPVGRRDYDEQRIRGSQSLLHVLARAGVAVQWLDNQSGCKGVCEGLPAQEMVKLNPPGLCQSGRCLDESLLIGLPERLAKAKGTQLLVLHMLGNHGPSYFRRYPPAFARFKPACNHDDLARCTQAEIVNAYDNALLYTDHVLAQLIDELQAKAQSVDSVLLFVSDHGESLGENGLYLHGLPNAIAPDVQKRVPMVMWFSSGLAGPDLPDLACIKERAKQPAAHDNLFHTLLGLVDVRTALNDKAWDLTQPCRKP